MITQATLEIESVEVEVVQNETITELRPIRAFVPQVKFSHSDISEAVQEVRIAVHGVPTMEEYTSYRDGDSSLPSIATVVKHYGSWNNGIKMNGMRPHGDSHLWRKLNFRK